MKQLNIKKERLNMWWYLIGSVMIVCALWSIQRTSRLYKKYDAKLAEMNEQTKKGYYPQVEIDKIMNTEIENFKEEHLDAIMYIQMAEGIKNGALDVVGAEGIVMISEEEYERLVRCDQLVVSMNEVAKSKDVVN